MDLRLYLETPWPDPSKPLHKASRSEALLFFKFYDPATETLRYVGHLFAPKACRMSQLYPLLRSMAKLPADAPLACFEEIKWEPTVLVEPIAGDALLHAGAELETGDIVAFQVAESAEAAAADTRYRHPTVRDFLAYKRNALAVKFRRLEAPDDDKGEGAFELELLRTMDYDAVVAALAARLGVADPDLLRLTPQNGFTQQPQRVPLRHRCPHELARVLSHGHHATDVLYYEVLDLPLPQLEALKTLRVHFHDERTRSVGAPLQVRVAADATFADVLAETGRQLPEEHAAKRLRLLEVFQSRIHRVCDEAGSVRHFNEGYWVLRAEPAPGDEGEAALVGGGAPPPPPGDGDLLVHCCHVAPDRQEQQQLLRERREQQQQRDQEQQEQQQQQKQEPSENGNGGGKAGGKKGGGKKQQQQQQEQENAAPDGSGGGAAADGDAAAGAPARPVQVLPFGDPFLLRIGRKETLADVKARIRAKLDVAPEAFAKWRFCFVPGGPRALPEYLGDDDVPAERFLAAAAGSGHSLGGEAAFLGCEHEDKGAKRPAGHRAAYGFERAVKINS